MNAPRLLEGLPGIDWGSPDTYETADEQPEHTNDALNIEKSDETAVSKIDTSVKDVRTTLKDKYLDANRVDFSDAPVKTRTTGYASNLELVSGEETPSQKLHRIMSELDELSGQVDANGADKADVSAKDILQEVDALRRRIGTIINAQVSSRPPAADSKAVTDLRQMIVSSSDGTSSSAAPLYRLYHHPDSDKQYQLAKAVELEAKLSRIESVLGNATASTTVSHVTGSSDSQKRDGMLEQLSTLESKISLLDPSKLDLIDARLASVLARMQALSNASQHSQSTSDPALQQMDPTKLQKLLHLHELLSSSAEHIQLLPKVIDRLTALSELHSQAVQMVDAMTFVEKSQAQLDAQLTTCQQLLEGVSHSLERSSGDIAAYCKRIEEVGTRKP